MNQTITTMLEQMNLRPTNEPLRLLTALGAKDMLFSDKDNFVQFSVKGDKGVNKVKVSYNEGQDLYDIEFLNINMRREEMVKVIDTVTGIFNEDLTDTIWRGVVIV